MLSPHLVKRLQRAVAAAIGRFVEVRAEDIVEAAKPLLLDPDIQAMSMSSQRVLPSRRGPRDTPTKRIWIETERVARLVKLIEDLQGG